MRRYGAVAVLVVAGWLAGVSGAEAQSAMLNLPRVSQHAEVMQRVGITDITIDYARPLAHGRKIFGGLAPYGKVWRAGANENTTIAFSDPVSINGDVSRADQQAHHATREQGGYQQVANR
jgi:Protein of unknown function (DUF2911)